jgi:hypothetical protein
MFPNIGEIGEIGYEEGEVAEAHHQMSKKLIETESANIGTL